MQRILTVLMTVVILLFIITSLYVFEVWPFNPGGPIISNSNTIASTQQNTSQETADILGDNGIIRTKSYDEYMSRGKLLEDKGYYSLAIAEFQAASQIAPTKADPLIQIGRMHIKESDYLKAKISFEEAIKIDPASTTAKIYLGRSLLSLRQPEDAKKVFNSITSNDQSALYYRGILALYYGDYENGKNLLNESIKIGGSDEYTQKAKNFLSAFDEFKTYQGGLPTHLKTLLARSFNQTGEYQLAIPLLYDVVKQKKDYRDAWILLGYSYLNIQKYQDAIEALEEAKKLDSQKPETLFFLGLAYYGVNDFQHAAQNLENAKKNGFQPSVQVDQKLAEIYLEMKNYKQSAASYENVVALNDEDVNYFIRPIWIYLERLNQPHRAVALAQKAVNAHPDEAMSYNLLGWAQIGVRNYYEAESMLKKALSMDPNLAAAYLNFGQLYEKQQKYEDAIAFYKKAYEMGNGSSISASAADKYNQLIANINTSRNNGTLKASLLNQ